MVADKSRTEKTICLAVSPEMCIRDRFHMTDTYVIDVQNPGNALDALMFVLAIDAEKCSRN